MAYLLAGFDTHRLGPMRVHASDTFSSGVATVTPGTYAHRDLSSVMGIGEYTPLATELDARLDGVLSSALASVAWNAATGAYTITSLGNASPVLDFRASTLGDASGQRLAAALGFTYQHPQATGGSSAAPFDIVITGATTSYTSNAKPYYYLALAKSGPSNYSRDFETGGQIRRQVSAKGRAFSIGPRTYERRTKFDLQFQALASTFADEATDAAPWTYEHLVTHARCHEPVVLSYDAEDLVYTLVRGEWDEDARSSVWGDYHGLWHISVEGQVLGRL